MTGTVTQCPNCETRFRVSQEQLEIADGRVRCGQCDHIFNALEHVAALQPDAASIFAAEKEEADPWHGISEEPVEAVQAELEREQQQGNIELSDSDIGEEEFSEFEVDSQTPIEPVAGAAADDQLDATHFGQASPDKTPPNDDELDVTQFEQAAGGAAAFSEDALDATQFERPAAEEARPEDDSRGATPAENAGSDEAALDNESLAATRIESSGADEAQAGDSSPAADELDDDDLLFDDLGPRHEQDVVVEELLRGDAVRESEFDDSVFASLEDGKLEEHEETRLELPPLHPAGQDEAVDQTMLAQPPVRARSQDSDTRWAMELIDDLQRDKSEQSSVARSSATDFAVDDATQLDSFSVSGNLDQQFDAPGYADSYVADGTEFGSDFDKARRGGWLWALACLLLVLLLATQYTAFNFSTLARDARFRPALEQACAFLPCELPVLEDLRKISFEKLVVRSHPEKDDSLMVNVVITNRAAFAQPFPVLELTFSDLRGNTVANESHYPSEYLRGELSGMTLMPSNNPIHLALDVADPGAAAINYKLKLVKGYD